MVWPCFDSSGAPQHETGWGSSPRSRLAVPRDIALRLPQPLRLLDVFVHCGLVGRGCYDSPVRVGLHAGRDSEPAVHVDPLVLETGKPALDLLEVREIVDLAEIRELFHGAHAQRVDRVDGAAERAVVVDHRGP